MSVRADDAVAAANRAQGFSLRDALGGFVGAGADAAARPLRGAPPMQALGHVGHGAVRASGVHFSLSALREPAATAEGPPRPVRAPAGLKLRVHESRTATPASVAALPREQFRPFSASELGIAPRAARTATPTSTGPASPGAAAASPSLAPSATAASAAAPAPASSATARSAATEANRADVMRLTAYVDDLTTRLHATQNKLEATERHLTRTSQALAVERQAATAKINALHRDVASTKEREDRLKTELSMRPPKAGLNTAKFASSVESALAGEGAVKAYTQQLAGLEEKVKALAVSKEALVAEVATLTSQRDAAAAEADEAVQRSDRVRTTAADLEANLRQARDACTVAEQEAEQRRKAARDLLGRAVELEATATARISAVVQQSPGSVDLLMEAMPTPKPQGGDGLLQPDVASAAAPVAAPPAAVAPARTAVRIVEAPYAATPVLGRSAHPALRAARVSAPLDALAIDAPLALHTTPVSAADVAEIPADPTTDLVSAVVQDLKEHFLQNKSARQPNAHFVAPLVK